MPRSDEVTGMTMEYYEESPAKPEGAKNNDRETVKSGPRMKKNQRSRKDTRRGANKSNTTKQRKELSKDGEATLNEELNC